VDQRSNIYNLGALMYYMLTGTPPFVGSSPDEVLEMHQKQEPESPNARSPELKLPRRAEALILKALSKSSSRRHLTLRQFLREVDALSAADSDGTAAAVDTLVPGAAGAAPPPSPPQEDEDTARDLPPTPGPGVADTVMDMKPLGAGADPGLQDTLRDRPATAEPVPPPPPVEAPPAAAPAVSDDAVTIPAERKEAPPPAVPAPPPAAAPAPPPEVAEEASSKAGELTTDAALKKPAIPDEARAPKLKPKRKGGAQPSAGGFRETLWFVKGAEESQEQEEGQADEETKPPVEASAEDLADKYKDDGSLGAAGAHHLSLRTGKTQRMKAMDMPSGEIPGEKMGDDDFISEMNRGRTVAIWVAVGAAVAAGAGALIYFLM
jgi:hypothetical protein